jgi:hypothetical protein
VVREMLAETLGAASALDQDAVVNQLDGAMVAVRTLIAGKHLGDTPLTLCSPPLRLEVTVVTGGRAIGLNELLGKVPGAATATDWTLHLPEPTPLTDWIREAIADFAHLTTDPPPVEKAAASEAALTGADIDIDALRDAVRGHG